MVLHSTPASRHPGREREGHAPGHAVEGVEGQEDLDGDRVGGLRPDLGPHPATLGLVLVGHLLLVAQDPQGAEAQDPLHKVVGLELHDGVEGLEVAGDQAGLRVLQVLGTVPGGWVESGRGFASVGSIVGCRGEV